MKEHVRSVHEGERPHECPHCTKAFARRPALNEHIRSVHENPPKCPNCDKSFASKSNLKQHMKKDLCGAKYKCSICDKTFSNVTKFNDHTNLNHKEIDESDDPSKSKETQSEITNNGDRAVERSEIPGLPVLFGGYNLPPLIETGLTDLSFPTTTGMGEIIFDFGEHKCSICTADFSTIENLQHHNEVFHNELFLT